MLYFSTFNTIFPFYVCIIVSTTIVLRNLEFGVHIVRETYNRKENGQFFPAIHYSQEVRRMLLFSCAENTVNTVMVNF